MFFSHNLFTSKNRFFDKRNSFVLFGGLLWPTAHKMPIRKAFPMSCAMFRELVFLSSCRR